MSCIPPETPPESPCEGRPDYRRPQIDRQTFDLRTRAQFERLVASKGTSPETAPQALMDVAWDYFVAGFTAGAQANRDLNEEGVSCDPLAEMVAALSPRRFEVLQLVARGLTNREVSEILGISNNTVKSHMAGLFESLEVTNRTEAAFALQCHDEIYGEERSN